MKKQPYKHFSKEVQESIERETAKLLQSGRKRDEIWISSEGKVLDDQDAGELAAHNRVFHPNATQQTRA